MRRGGKVFNLLFTETDSVENLVVTELYVAAPGEVWLEFGLGFRLGALKMESGKGKGRKLE